MPLTCSGSSKGRSSKGTVAGLYDLEEVLGTGHFAEVRVARHVFTGARVAVKVIDKTKLDDVAQAHLYQEVRCMKLVQHPNVVRLYEVIDTHTKLYLVLELGDGGDMYDYIMKHHGRGVSEDTARHYFCQILSAIDYCHKRHVVHRDLKPENVIFFKMQDVAKVTDFGFSNCFRPGEKLSTSCGSLAYSAPEILLGDSYDAPSVDVWSLGVILYMLVCGKGPFCHANDSETLAKIMDCSYHLPTHLSECCRSLIASMLVRLPEQRATLSQITHCSWLKGGVPSSVSSSLLSSEILIPNSIHLAVLKTMEQQANTLREDVISSLEENRYDHISATYFLIAERFLKKHTGTDAVHIKNDGKHYYDYSRTILPPGQCRDHTGLRGVPTFRLAPSPLSQVSNLDSLSQVSPLLANRSNKPPATRRLLCQMKSNPVSLRHIQEEDPSPDAQYPPCTLLPTSTFFPSSSLPCIPSTPALPVSMASSLLSISDPCQIGMAFGPDQGFVSVPVGITSVKDFHLGGEIDECRSSSGSLNSPLFTTTNTVMGGVHDGDPSLDVFGFKSATLTTPLGGTRKEVPAMDTLPNVSVPPTEPLSTESSLSPVLPFSPLFPTVQSSPRHRSDPTLFSSWCGSWRLTPLALAGKSISDSKILERTIKLSLLWGLGPRNGDMDQPRGHPLHFSTLSSHRKCIPEEMVDPPCVCGSTLGFPKNPAVTTAPSLLDT